MNTFNKIKDQISLTFKKLFEDRDKDKKKEEEKVKAK